MYEVSATNHADYDLDKIINYISLKLSAPEAASDFLDEVYTCYDRLEENPYIYEECRDPKLKKEGYRRVVIKNYVMIYKIYEDSKEVVVHGFFYGRQDYVNLL